jgi:hypothetical protein
MVMRTLPLAGYDPVRGEEFGRLLGGLMNLTRPYIIDVVRKRLPALLK